MALVVEVRVQVCQHLEGGGVDASGPLGKGG